VSVALLVCAHLVLLLLVLLLLLLSARLVLTATNSTAIAITTATAILCIPTQPWSSVQFHPEAMGGPMDTGFLFETFIGAVRGESHKLTLLEPHLFETCTVSVTITYTFALNSSCECRCVDVQ
jgi:Glutamine amidotransferase class-I